MIASDWKFAAASVRGKGHEQTGTPCQDAFAVQESVDGRWLALVASDGAGSAARAEFSARFVASEFARILIKVAQELDRQLPGAWVTDSIIEEIVRLRKAIRQEAKSDNISDFHCTLVAALVGPSRGFTIHLGDGSVFGGDADPSSIEGIDLSQGFFLSEPENGEYANETVFLTERDWIKHLRIHPLSLVNWIVLGTDGGMALAMVEEKAPKLGFIAPVMRAIFSYDDPEARADALKTILEDRQADRLTNDDKTLAVAARSKCIAVKDEFQPSLPEAAPSVRATPLTPQQPREKDQIPLRWRATESCAVSDDDKKTHTETSKRLTVLWIKLALGVASLGMLVFLTFVVSKCFKCLTQTTNTQCAVEEATILERPPEKPMALEPRQTAPEPHQKKQAALERSAGTNNGALPSSAATPASLAPAQEEEGPK